MPSNKDLTKQITEIGLSMGASQEDMDKAVEGLNNDKLAKMLKQAKAEKAELEASEKGKEPAAIETKSNDKPAYYVADGKSITCKKGVLDSGEEIKAEYLGENGQKSLDSLVKKEVVIKS